MARLFCEGRLALILAFPASQNYQALQFLLRFKFHWNFYAGNIFALNAGLAAGLITQKS